MQGMGQRKDTGVAVQGVGYSVAANLYMLYAGQHTHMQGMGQKEDTEVAVQGVGMFPEGAGVERLNRSQLKMAPAKQACLR